MIEIALGILVLAAALAAALGLAEGMLPIPIGLPASALMAVLGVLLFSHGFYRIRLKRNSADRHWLRSTGLMSLMLALLGLFAIALPLLAPLLNAFKLAGFPLGFYVAAQGSLVALVVLLFVYAARADAIDEQEEQREE